MTNRESVFDTLDRSNAQLLAEHTINRHFKTAHWTNALDRVSYHADQVHTLSFYLQGGEGSRRIDVDRGSGHTGSLCIFPQFHESQWEITAPFSFAHLYFSDESIKQFASTTLDIEPRSIEVPELTFHDDAKLVALAQQLFSANDTSDVDSHNPLKQEQTIQLIFQHLLSDRRYCLHKKSILTGGLSPALVRRIKAYIHQYYYRAVHLAELAEIASLSEYHLLRMFKASTGFTPNEYLMHTRVEKAKQAIVAGQSLADIALSCGFSSQSHFNRVFKQRLGVTPGTFKSVCSQ